MMRKKRNGYYYFNDKEYVSVTKVLGEVLAKPALYYWSGQQAARIALKNPELNEKEVMAELQLLTKKAQHRGHQIHEYAEALSKGKPIEVSSEYAGYCQAMQSWWKTHSPVRVANEVEVYSDEYMTAGRCDFICKMNKENWLIDWKSGKAIYRESGLQLAFYKHGLKERGVISIDKTGVVLLKEDGEWEFRETVDTIEDFGYVRSVWGWMRRKE